MNSRGLRSICYALVLVVMAITGCTSTGGSAGRYVHESPSSRGSDEAVISGADIARIEPDHAVRIVDLSFDVFRADLPLRDGRDSRMIWNHVDEMRADPAIAARLGRNGFRIGAAPPGSWAAIQAVLEAAGARTYRSVLAPPRGVPLIITMGPVQERESIFTYNKQSRLVGKTFNEGDKLIVVDYVFQPQFGGFTELQVGFEVRHDKGVMTWSREGGVIRQVPAFDRHVFSDLVVRMTLQGGECLVVGPSETATNQYLIGGRYLSIEHDGAPYESILFITPTPYQTKSPVGGRR